MAIVTMKWHILVYLGIEYSIIYKVNIKPDSLPHMSLCNRQ